MNRNFYLFVCLLLVIMRMSYSQTTIYARSSGNWNVTTTWSTVGPAGISCGCTPTTIDSVVVNSFDVNVNVNSDCKSLTILNASSVTINNNIGLDINAGIVEVQTGGTLTHSGINSNAHIDFETGTNLLIVESGSTFEIEDVNMAGAVNLDLSGAGTVTLTDDFSFLGANTNLVNDLTGNLDLTGASSSSLWYQSSSNNCTFVNNGTVNCDRYLVFDSQDNTFTNNGTFNLTNSSFGVLLSSGNASGTLMTNSPTGTMTIQGDFNVLSNQITFNNNGALDLEGDLSSWSGTAPSEFHNLPGSTFNFAGTGEFYGDFYANYDANTVVFDNASTLQNELIDPEDNYWNLTFSGFQKHMKSNITCLGDFILNVNAYITAGRAIIMNNGGTLTLNSGGSLTQPSGSGTLIFSGNYDYDFVVNDVTTGFDWNQILVNGNSNININGNGRVNLKGNFTLFGDNSTVNHNLTGDFSVKNIFYSSSKSGNTFISNEDLTITSFLGLDGTSNTYTNFKETTIGTEIRVQGTDGLIDNKVTGTINVANDLFFNGSSGYKVSNAGTFNVNGAAFTDGIQFGGTQDSIVNSGSFNVIAGMRVLANTNDDNVFINQVGATYNLGEDFQLNDADFVFDNYGTFNLDGRFDDFAGTEAIYNRAGATINYNGLHNVNLNAEISLYADFNSNDFNYTRSDGTGQLIISPQDAYWDLNLMGSGDKELEADVDVNNDVNITGTSILVANSHSMTVASDWLNASHFTEGTGEVVFDGTGTQQIVSTNPEIFYDLTLNKASGNLIINDDIEVSNTLTLTQGAVFVNQNTISVSRQSPDAVVQTSGYLISDETDNSSRLKRNVGSVVGSYLFPFGKVSGDYVPFNLELTAGDIGEVTVSTYFTGSDNLPLPTSPTAVLNLEGAIVDNSTNVIDRFWQIDKTGVSGTATMTFTYADSEVSSNVSASESMLEAQRYNSSAGNWDSALPDQTANAGANTVLVPGVTAFSPWTLALSTAPLPITLIDFKASYVQNNVQLTWITSMEENNDYFTIEKSYDLRLFTPIATISGAGTSYETLSYEYTDASFSPGNGAVYYRLKQTDYDGTFTYSDIISVTSKERFVKNVLSIYPNPSTWNGYEILFPKVLDGEGVLIISDHNGREFLTRELNISNDFVFKPNEFLESGQYILSLSIDGKVYQSKLVVRNE